MSVTRTHFEDDLKGLQDELLHMGSEADRLVAQAMRALTEHDRSLAEDVIRSDDTVDDLDLDVESKCMRMIALQQPMARDLRLIGTALKIITDIERIADHAVDIAKVARKLARDEFYKPLVDIPWMGDRVREMLRNALLSFVNHDLELVERVVAADDEIDDLFRKLREELHAAMSSNPQLVVQASYLLFVAHYLERIADHAVNIAERVHYVETGTLEQLAKSHAPNS